MTFGNPQIADWWLFLVFAEVPTLETVVGAGLLILSGLALIARTIRMVFCKEPMARLLL